MKKQITSILLLCFAISAQAQTHTATTLSPRLQRIMDVLNKRQANTSILPTAALAKTTGTTKERVKSIFIDYGSGNDSLILFYGSNYRGSSYNYSQIAEYDGGYQYLNNSLYNMRYDSLDYKTSPHNGPWELYLKRWAGYAADTNQNEISGRLDVSDQAGGLKKYSKYFKTYDQDLNLTDQYDFRWKVATMQYDSISEIHNTWLSPSSLATKTQLYTAASQKPNQQKTVNTYNVAGLLVQNATFAWDTMTHNWEPIPYNSTSFTYNGAGKTTSIITRSGDTSKVTYTYNPAGQKVQDSTFFWDAASSSFAMLAAVRNYSFPNASSDWTKSKTLIIDPNTNLFGFLNDSMTRTLDAQNQVLTSFDYFDDGYGNLYLVPDTSVWYATGKIASYKQVVMDVAYTDTFTQYVTLTYNAAGNPLTRVAVATDANGGPLDTVNNWQDWYRYENYVDPTRIADVAVKINSLKAFPNPATNELHLTCKDMTKARLTITNTLGQVVVQYDVQLGIAEAIIPVQQLPGGVYIVTLRDNEKNASASTKILKQ